MNGAGDRLCAVQHGEVEAEESVPGRPLWALESCLGFLCTLRGRSWALRCGLAPRPVVLLGTGSLRPRNIFQGTARGQNVSVRQAGPGRHLERPLLVLGGVQDAEALEVHGSSSQRLLALGEGTDGCLFPRGQRRR